MAYEALESLQQTLLQILVRGDYLITPPVKYQIISIHDRAVVLQLNLNQFPYKESIRDVANTAKEIIQSVFSLENLSICGSITVRLSDQLGQLAEQLQSTVAFMVGYIRQRSDSAIESEVEDPTEMIAINSNGLRRLAENIMSIGRESEEEDSSDSHVSVGFDDDLNDSAALDLPENPSDSPSIYPPTSKDDVIGFDEDIAQLMERVTDYSLSNRQILPIVGMGGIGKSTLAKYVYNHPMIMHQYDIRAWVTVSQDCCIVNILSQLLASLKGKVGPVGTDSLIVIDAEKLEIFKILSGRRYLIVIDDIWSVEAWDHVQKLFPDNNNGSWIILTTRLMDVATYAAISWNIHVMRFMDDEDSWRLFQHKVFGDHDCPLELQSVGEKIVKRCGGLPLSIVTMAGLLSRIPRTPKLWQQIEVNDGQLVSILYLSYNHLPLHLRKCFLYMAGFPQEYDIRASELIKLWVAEGFLECRNESKSIEMTAEECLEDLIKQSLVLISSRKSDGKIKSCRLHSMVWDFCVRQAGKEKFILSVTEYFPNLILRRHFLPQVLQNHHRISVSWYDLNLKDYMHSSCTTSIICIPQRGYRPKGSVKNFTSLRVLHVLRRNDHSYWELGQVFELIYLTYLASYIPDDIVSAAIAKLQNLQTLIIYRSNVHLPVEIWSLRQLRNLIAFSFCPLLLPEGETLSLENLHTLHMATNFTCSGRMVGMLPNIKKLGICYPEVKFGVGYHLGNLIHLFKLEKLKLNMHNSYVPRLNPIFPLSLKKLELSGGWIYWRDMTIVGSLPNLQVLKLKNYACYGEHWGIFDEEFGNLVHLLIDESNLKCWTIECSPFPRLQSLTLLRCPYLDEIPYDIGLIPLLQVIEIDDHNQSLLYSAKKIQEERQDWVREDLKVVVKRS